MGNRTTGQERREMRHKRVRNKVQGTDSRPRLAVFRSLRHIYAQVIDDSKGCALVAASSMEIKGEKSDSMSLAQAVGNLLASRAKEKGIAKVVFDRGGYRYHGRVAALGEAARKAGLEF